MNLLAFADPLVKSQELRLALIELGNISLLGSNSSVCLIRPHHEQQRLAALPFRTCIRTVQPLYDAVLSNTLQL